MRKFRVARATQPVPPFEKLGKPPAGVDRASHALRYGGAAMLHKLAAMINRLGQLEPHWLSDPDAAHAYLLLDYMLKARSHAESPGGGRRPPATLRVTMPDGTVKTVQGFAAAAELTGRTVSTLRQAIYNSKERRVHFARRGSQQAYTVERA